MHYKNGCEAKNGDKVIWMPTWTGMPFIGILYDAQAGNDYCNGRLAITHVNDPSPNLKECLPLDDIFPLQEMPTVEPDEDPNQLTLELHSHVEADQ